MFSVQLSDKIFEPIKEADPKMRISKISEIHAWVANKVLTFVNVRKLPHFPLLRINWFGKEHRLCVH